MTTEQGFGMSLAMRRGGSSSTESLQ